MKYDQFTASTELIALLNRYKNDYDKPDSEYYSEKKQAEMLDFIANEMKSCITANSSNKPRLIELTKHWANRIIEECDSDKYLDEDRLPNKNTVLAEDSRLIEEQLQKDMVGKIICYKHGAFEKYIKIASTELANADRHDFEFAFRGNTLCVLPDDIKDNFDHGVNLGYSIDNYLRIRGDLFTDGENQYTKERLLLVTEKQMQFVVNKQTKRILVGMGLVKKDNE